MIECMSQTRRVTLYKDEHARLSDGNVNSCPPILTAKCNRKPQPYCGNVFPHDRAEKVGTLGEQRVDAPIVGKEARHVHDDRRGGHEGEKDCLDGTE